MTEKEFIRATANRARELRITGISQAHIAAILDVMKEEFYILMTAGDKLTLHGIGRFVPKITPEHKGRNMQTGKICVVPEKGTVKFIPCAELKEEVDAGQKGYL